MNARTGDKVSSLAGKHGGIVAADIRKMDDRELNKFAAEVRSMAASLRRQDEHKGPRGFVARLLAGGRKA